MIRKISGVVIFIVGILLAAYLNLWCLFSGLIDIFQHGNLVSGIIKIILREVIGILGGGALIIIGATMFGWSFFGGKKKGRSF